MPAIWYNSFIITYHELIPLRISWSSNKGENDSPNLSILIAFLDFGPGEFEISVFKIRANHSQSIQSIIVDLAELIDFVASWGRGRSERGGESAQF
jgi:hypothetical protein